MIIGGMVKNSFVDFPHKIACVVFTVGCNFNCWYCHNSHLVDKNHKTKIAEAQVFEFLKQRKDFLDGVVVSGGEPTLQYDLIDFISKVKEMGYLVKLDTNGSNYKILKYLIDNNLVDYVAMDIKAPLDDYHKIIGVDTDIEQIKSSINLLLQNKVDYEFRTTYSPDLNANDIEEICKTINGAKNYSIQKYRVVEYNKVNMMPRSREEHLLAQEIARKYVHNVVLKGVD